MENKKSQDEVEKKVRKIQPGDSLQKESEDPHANHSSFDSNSLDSLDITLEDLFTLDRIQQIQDEFSDATGVASLITRVDGTPLTQPSNFCRLCQDFIRRTEKGLMNCVASDSIIGRYDPAGPIIQPCLSSGLWDAGAGIMVGGKHIACWMIGQVRNEKQTDEQMAIYARNLGVDEAGMIEAFHEVPSMSLEKFTKIAKMLFTFANQLSESVYQNLKKTYYINERRKIEKNLVKSEKKYRALVESSIDCIWEMNKDGVFTYISPKVKDMLGYDASDIVGKTPFVLMSGQEAERARAAFNKSVEEEMPYRGRINKVYDIDGSERLIETNGVPIINERGKIVGFIGTDRDITENRKLQLRIEQSEATLKSIFRAAPIAIGMVKDHILTWANDYLFEMTGYESDELIGIDTKKLYLSEDELKRVRREMYACIEKRNIAVLESQWMTKKGEVIDVQFNGTALKSKSIQDAFIFTVQNISDRKEYERRLIDSEKNYREIFNSINDVLVIHDIDTCSIVDANSKSKELYGYDPSELIGKTVETISAGVSPFTVDDGTNWIKLATDEGPQVFEWLARNKSGETFWVEVNLKKASIGGTDRLLAVSRDIRQRKAYEQELAKYREHLEEQVDQRSAEIKAKNKELEMFTYSVSHDLKAPLRGIDGYSRLLIEEYSDKLDEDGLFFINNIRQGTTQMNQLIEDLLAYSRMERKDLHHATININLLIDKLVSQVAHEIEQCQIEIKIHVPFQAVESDMETLRQVLANYIDNAIKYSKKDTPGELVIGGEEDEDYWTLWVKDTGIGFDPQYVDRIFEIFQRLHRIEEYPGTGVGLAIVRKAVERIGGRVRASSIPGEGSCFYLDIPKQKQWAS